MEKNNRVFVYGTLKRGYGNHRLIEPYIAKVTEAAVRGWLYDLGAFPAMVEGDGWVFGELVEFHPENADAAFAAMDRLEGVDAADPSRGLYMRGAASAQTADGGEVRCETYRMTKRRADRFGLDALLPGGAWPRGTEAEHVPYVAYGSCMSASSFGETAPGCRVVGRAEIPGRRVAFTRYSAGRGGGVADLLEAPGQAAEGVLYLLPPASLDALDRREGAPYCYRRVMVPVVCGGRLFQALTYEVVSKAGREIAPHLEYVRLIMDGAGLLSREYVESLRKHIDSLSKGAV